MILVVNKIGSCKYNFFFIFWGAYMEIKTGYLYHIKNIFFDIVNDRGLMINHEKGHSRPSYLAIKNNNLLWFVPISSKVDKYKKIVNQKIKKYGACKSIMIRKIANQEVAILLQNAFPICEEYVSHIHTMKNGNPLKVIDSLKKEIINNFNYMLSMKQEDIDLFFTDIDKIKEIMLEELTIKE